jgi:hypothetical protein
MRYITQRALPAPDHIDLAFQHMREARGAVVPPRDDAEQAVLDRIDTIITALRFAHTHASDDAERRANA